MHGSTKRSPEHQKILDERRYLPIYTAREALCKEFVHNALVIVGETGSGEMITHVLNVFQSI
jgi:HrpA-like RNA helicase